MILKNGRLLLQEAGSLGLELEGLHLRLGRVAFESISLDLTDDETVYKPDFELSMRR